MRCRRRKGRNGVVPSSLSHRAGASESMMCCSSSSLRFPLLLLSLTTLLGYTHAQSDYALFQVYGNSNRCLGVGTSSRGQPVQLYDCDANDDLQQWRINGDDQLELRATPNRCAERIGSGDVVEIRDCDTTLSNQRWRFDDRQVRLRDSSRCMQYNSESFREDVITRSCDFGSDQEFERVVTSENGDDGDDDDEYMRYYIRDNDNRCLGADSTSTNTPLELFECDDDDRRLWRLNPDTDQLQLRADPSRCAERVGSGFAVELQSCNTGITSQRWEFDGTELRLRDSSRCMQFDFSEDILTEVITRSCDGGSDQEWARTSSSNVDPTPDNNIVFSEFKKIRFATDTDKCVGASSTSSGTRLRLESCVGDGSDLQTWQRDGQLFRLNADTNRCARREGGFGSDVVLDFCDELDTKQQWDYDIDGNLLVQSEGNCWEPISGDDDQIEMRICGSTNQEFDYGDYDYVRFADEDRCLAAPSTSTSGSNFLELESCMQRDFDGFRLWRLGTNNLLRLYSDPTTCAALSNGGEGARLRLVDCFANDSFQRWEYNANQNGEMQNADWNRCMQYESDVEILAYTCDSGADQMWEFGADSSDYVMYQVFGSTDQCLGVDDANEFTILQLIQCDEDNDFGLWSLDDDNLLRLKANPNRCAQRTGTGERVELRNCVIGRSNQEWRYDGGSNELRLSGSSQCMEYGSSSVGQDIFTYSCDGQSNQRWEEQVTINGSGRTAELVEVRPRGNENRCLGTVNTFSGTVLSLFTCDRDDRRIWYYDENNMLRLNADRDRCASRSNTSQGNLLRLVTCDTGDALQIWTHADGEDGDFEIRSSNQCMQFNSESVGEEIRAFNCDLDSNQEWDVFQGQGERNSGQVMFLNDPNDCDMCIGVTSIGNGANLQWMDCAATARDRLEWRFENDENSLASRWCLVADDTLCVTPGDPLEGRRLSIRSRSSVSSDSQLWFYDFVNFHVTHSSSEELCVGVASNQRDLTMVPCVSSDLSQQWRIEDPGEQENTCQTLEVQRTDGKIVFLNSDEDCDLCVVITGCSSSELCVNPRLEVTNCFYSDDRAYLKYWEEVPSSGGTTFCNRDVDICLLYTNGGIELVDPDDEPNNQNLIWYFDSQTDEISPRISDGLCMATDETDVFIEECSLSSLNKKNWDVEEFLRWSGSCKPTGRAPGALQGVLISIENEDNCDMCLGVDTSSSRTPFVGLARCFDNDDDFETLFREGLVPSENTQWCLDSDSSICIAYDPSASSGLVVMDGDATGGQMERWYYERNQITPLTRADRCVSWECSEDNCSSASAREISTVDCNQASDESVAWTIVSANEYSCSRVGTSSVTSAAGLGIDFASGATAVMLLVSSVLVYVII